MALNGTYTSNFLSVTDGDTTDVKPSLLADTSKQIRLKNFEVRWRGDRSSTTNTEYSNWVSNSDSATAYENTNNYTAYERNDNYATATPSTSEKTNTTSKSISGNEYPPTKQYNNLPSTSGFNGTDGDYFKMDYTLTAYSGYSGFANIEGSVGFSGGSSNAQDSFDLSADQYGSYSTSGTVKVYYSPFQASIDLSTFSVSDSANPYINIDATITAVVHYTTSSTGYASTSYPSVPNGYSFHKHIKDIDGNQTQYFSNKVGNSVQVSSSSGSTDLQLTTIGEDDRSNTTVKNDTASASFPSPPSGYDFYRHRIEKSDGTDNYFNTNSVGESRSITSTNTSNTVSVTASTRGINEYIVYTQTKTPSLSGDASLSPNISSVENDTTTSWYSLSNLLPNSTNTLQHDIQGSNKAEFQYRFDWGVAFPEPVYGKVAFYNNELDRWEETAVADSTDELLEYSHIEVYNESMGEWGCLDVVDASKTAAIEEYRFYDAETDKWLAPRKYSSTQV